MSRRYRTEIVIPADRFVCLQLPDDMPEGLAIVLVRVEGPGDDGDGDGDGDSDPPAEGDPDREDIEWWDDFDGGNAGLSG